MSKQIHDERKREQSRDTQVKFRCPESLLESFDEWVIESDHDNRSSALRAAMRSSLGAREQHDLPREPPQEEPLQVSYQLLAGLATADGIVRHDIAVTELSTKLSKPKETIAHTVLHRLRQRGYLQQLSNIHGERAWRLRD